MPMLHMVSLEWCFSCGESSTSHTIWLPICFASNDLAVLSALDLAGSRRENTLRHTQLHYLQNLFIPSSIIYRTFSNLPISQLGGIAWDLDVSSHLSNLEPQTNYLGYWDRVCIYSVRPWLPHVTFHDACFQYSSICKIAAIQLLPAPHGPWNCKESTGLENCWKNKIWISVLNTLNNNKK